MAASAGFNGVVQVSADDSSYSDIGIANQASQTTSTAMLDVSRFETGAVVRIAGLHDFPISVSGHYDDSDTGQSLIRSSQLSRTPIYVKILPDGTNGIKVLALVESFETSVGVADTATFSVSFQSTALATVI